MLTLNSIRTIFNFDSIYIHDSSTSNFVTIVLLVSIILILVLLLPKKKKKTWRLPLPPGPKGLPILGYVPFLGKYPNKTLLELSKKYKSNIIRIKLGHINTIIFNEYNTMKEALSNVAAQNRNEDMYSGIPEIGFQTLNGEEWEEQRRFSMHTAKELGLGRGAWEKMLQEEVQSFLDEIASYEGKAFNIVDPLGISVGNNVLALIIGRRLQKGVEDNKIRLLIDYPVVALSSLAPTFLTSIFPRLRKLLEALKVSSYVRASKIIHGFRNMIWEEMEKQKRVSDNENNSNFINLYRASMQKKTDSKVRHYFSEHALAGNMNILFLGAADTTASSIEWLIYLMARHPDVQRKVQEELDEVLGTDGVASYYERDRIPYTFATMMEAQRVASIVPLSSPRRVIKDFELGGYTIPKGSDISGNTWAVHNDPKYWPNPEKFMPERFLTESKKVLTKPEGFAAFSFGRRRCPGEIIAWMEILIYFTSILRNFDIVMPPGEKLEWEIISGLVTHLKMRPLKFVKRESKQI